MTILQKSALVNHILSLPYAPEVAKEVNEKLEAERTRRNKFYNDTSEFEKAEFINGEIIIHSPVDKRHNDISSGLFRLISLFVQVKKLGYVGYEKLMITLSRNDYEPDICFFNNEKSKAFKTGQSLFPAPDLIVEVLSKRTAKNDRGIKFEDYQAHGVQEYWIIDPIKKIVEQYRLDKKGNYELILKAKKGSINCSPIKGFQIEIEAIFNDQKNLEALKKILH